MRNLRYIGVMAFLVVVAAAGTFGQDLSGLGGGFGQPQETPRFQVSAELQPGKQQPGGQVKAIVSFTCAPEHYLYAHKLSAELVQADRQVEDATEQKDDAQEKEETQQKDEAGEEGNSLKYFSAGELSLPEPKSKFDQWLDKEVQYFEGEFQVELPVTIAAEAPTGKYALTLQAGYQGCGPERCYLPQTKDFTVTLQVAGEPKQATAGPTEREAPPEEPAPKEEAAGEEEAAPQETAPEEGAGGDQGVSRIEQSGFVGRLVIAFLAGLALVLTPCIYPMIPITVGVVGAAAGESRLSGFIHSLFYVLGISLTYAALGLAAAMMGAAFGSLAQHPAVYIFLAVIFVLLAGGMLDLYVIQLPTGWAQKLQNKFRGKGGLAGVFVMGLLSGLVATPCVAPLLAAILAWIARQGDVVQGFLMLFVVAWGMGVPLIVLGTFTGLLKSLPKAGGWMVAVKHALGAILIGVAVYLVGQSGLLSDFWYYMVVAAFLITVSVFAGAFDSLDRESGWAERARKALGLIILAAGIVVFVGPFMPEQRAGTVRPQASINWITSEEEGLQMAQRQGKPVMIDFRADWCTVCKQIEQETFTDPRVVEKAEEFVCIKVDTTDMADEKKKKLWKEYGIQGYPHIEFLDASGRQLEKHKINQFVAPEELLPTMDQVLEESASGAQER